MTIAYSIRPVSPNAHLFQVRLCVDNIPADGMVFRLPNWIPGSYMIRDFSQHIVEITARDGDRILPLEKLDKSSWRLAGDTQAAELQYSVYAWDLSVRKAHLDDSHGFFNGTSVFLAVEGREDEPVDVELLPPEGEAYRHWQLASAMTPIDVDERGFGRYRADDYDELIDHPVEMGTFTRVTFEACGVPHELVLTGRFHTDLERVCRDLQRICEYQIRFFGEPAPVDRYVFLVMVTGDGYGGLEHRASTALVIGRHNLPVPGEEAVSDDYLQFLGLCSHEYFHTWNVKRIKPAVFEPYALDTESYTRLLWFFEGATSYYDDLVLVRCGLIDVERYLGVLAKTVSRIQQGGGRLKQSVTDSSFDAWHKFYKQDENAVNAIVSYYAKGALACWCLDARLRELSDGAVTLDTLMRALWAAWLGGQRGIAEDEPETLAANLVGKDLTAFFRQVLYSTEELPLDAASFQSGVALKWQPRGATGDAARERKDKVAVTPVWSGCVCQADAQGFKVQRVFSGGAAEQAGLAAGDVLIALDRLALRGTELDPLLQRYAGESEIDAHYFRHGELRTTRLPIQPVPGDQCVLSIADDARIQAWLDVQPGTQSQPGAHTE